MSRRLALITGASAGIGAAFARIYAGNGYDVALTARRADKLEAIADEIRLRAGVETYVIEADLAEPDAPDKILEAVGAHGRTIDALINNAGYGVRGAYSSKPWETHQEFLQVMVTAPCELARKTLPAMASQGFGRIVNVASVAGKEGNPNASAYSASKGGVIAFTKSLGKELATKGVLVNCLTPATFESPILDQLPQSQVDYMKSKIPMGRLGKTGENAALVCWLVSEECSFSTAATFDTSGGRTTY